MSSSWMFYIRYEVSRHNKYLFELDSDLAVEYLFICITFAVEMRTSNQYSRYWIYLFFLFNNLFQSNCHISLHRINRHIHPIRKKPKEKLILLCIKCLMFILIANSFDRCAFNF